MHPPAFVAFTSRFDSTRAVPAVVRAFVREDFARIQDPVWIERVFETPLERDELVWLFEVQVRRLENADAVFTRKCAAQRDDFFEQTGDTKLHERELIGAVPQVIAVQVAVPCVTVGERLNAGLFADVSHELE